MTVPFDRPASADLATAGPLPRRRAIGVQIGEGKASVMVGGHAPIIVQSMTNTLTSDARATIAQRFNAGTIGPISIRVPLGTKEHVTGVNGKALPSLPGLDQRW